MTRHRVVSGLKYATTCERPEFIPRSRPRGVKGDGLRYERKVAKAVPGAEHSPWFMYFDHNGEGWCNPDLMLRVPQGIVVLECKLTDTWQAKAQIEELYAPVVAMATGERVFGITVARNLSPRTELRSVVGTLSSALERALAGEIPLLHWLGVGPIDRRAAPPKGAEPE